MPDLKADIKVGETLRFNGSGSTSITLIAKSGQRARLEISADDSIRITQPEQEKPQAAPMGLGQFTG